MNKDLITYCRYYRGENTNPFEDYSDDALFYEAEKMVVSFAEPNNTGDLWFYDNIVSFICKWQPYEQERLIRKYFKDRPEMIERYEVYF